MTGASPLASATLLYYTIGVLIMSAALVEAIRRLYMGGSDDISSL
jgi:hypothetical protein